MKKDRLTLPTIVSEIEREIENVKELQSELRSITDKRGIIYTRSKGSILHDFYSGCERTFKKIAIEVNEGYEETERWHKALLYRMTIALKDIRPQVISEELAADLDEYLPSFQASFSKYLWVRIKGR